VSRHVLVVDDNVDLADNVRELLELEGCEVTTFNSPIVAMREGANLAFDAAILDIRMPGIDGVELCAALARTHPNATIVLMTAFTSEQRVDEARKAGAKAVLKKPLPIDRLLELLAKDAH
jgi:DNA-binding NtrC family response regulator